MIEAFFSTFFGNAQAIAKILMVVLLAGILVRKNIIKQQDIKSLSELTVTIFLPAMIFSNVMVSFNPETKSDWWLFPLIGIFMPLINLGFAILFFPKSFKQNQPVLAISVFQNAAYLVLPIGKLLFPEQFDEFALYNFLFIMGFNPMLWSVGKYLITYNDNYKKPVWTDLVTPPLVANLLAIALVLLKVNTYVPAIIMEPIALTGSATVPVATFVLGATIGGISFSKFPPVWVTIRVLIIKFLLIPIAMLVVIKILHLSYSLFVAFLVIEAAAAPATNLMVMVRKYGGNLQLTGSLMLIMYLAALLFMPLWITIAQLYI